MQDIDELNKKYLLVVNRLALSDPALAAQVSGLSPETLQRVAKLSIFDIERTCENTKLLFFQPRMPESVLLRLAEMPEQSKNAYLASAITITASEGTTNGAGNEA